VPRGFSIAHLTAGLTLSAFAGWQREGTRQRDLCRVFFQDTRQRKVFQTKEKKSKKGGSFPARFTLSILCFA
jgi:hypothetical protein